MSWLKKLFGGSAEKSGPAKTLEYKGFTIEAQPYLDGGQYQLAGRITKQIGGEVKTYSFVRADKFTDLETAADIALSKGQLIIDQMGEGIFKE